MVYIISDPLTGDQEDFKTLHEAKKAAKTRDYTPVYIDHYDENESDIVGDTKVNNPGKTLIK